MNAARFLCEALATTALVLGAALAHASMGVTELPAAAGDGPVTVFYPSTSPAAPVSRGPFTLMLADKAPPVAGNRRLVVISHGSGGTPWVQTDLARRLVDDGYVVAFPQHQGDHAGDMSQVGPPSWRRRPVEVSRAIDAVARDSRFAPLLALDRVGAYGLSAGGHTALTLAGGRWSPSVLLKHCEAHLDDDYATCAGPSTRLTGGVLDGMKKSITRGILSRKLDDATWYQHDEPRIAAVVAEVPFAADFDPASLARPRVPLGIVQAGGDRWLTPRFHSGVILKACAPSCTLVADVPGAGHGSFLSPPPPREALPDHLAWLLGDPPGFDRAQVPVVHGRIVEFFRQHLLP